MEQSSQLNDYFAFRWLALMGLGLAIAFINIDLTIVNVALPVIAREFHSSLVELQWVNNAYNLGITCGVILIGRIADQYGHKKVFLIGVTIFFLGSLLSGLAPNSTFLITARVIQGIGMAGTFTMIFILATRAFPESQQAFAIGVVVLFTGVSQALGPSLGGIILHYLSWRWIFYLNLPLCVLTIVICWFACAKDTVFQKQFIHIPSVGLLIFGLFLLLLAINQSQLWGLTSTAFLLSFIFSIVILIILFLWQFKLVQPFIEFDLFKIKDFALMNCIRPLFQFNFGVYLFLIPIYLQNILGYSPLYTGLLLLLMSGVLGVSAPLTGKITDKIGTKYPCFIAQCLSAISFIALFLSLQWQTFWLMAISFVLIGINVGAMYATTNFSVVTCLPKEKKGSGTGIFVTIAFYAYSLGIAIAGLVISLVAKYVYLHQLTDITHIHKFPEVLKFYITGAKPLDHLQKLGLPDTAAKMLAVKHAFIVGYQVVLIICTVIALISLYFIQKLDNIKPE